MIGVRYRTEQDALAKRNPVLPSDEAYAIAEYEEVFLTREQVLDLLYKSRPDFKEVADEIHSRRMLPGPACYSCMEFALKKLGIKLE